MIWSAWDHTQMLNDPTLAEIDDLEFGKGLEEEFKDQNNDSLEGELYMRLNLMSRKKLRIMYSQMSKE